MTVTALRGSILAGSGCHRRGRLQQRLDADAAVPAAVYRSAAGAAFNRSCDRVQQYVHAVEVTVAVGGRVSFETGTAGRSTSCRTRHWFTPTVHRSRR